MKHCLLATEGPHDQAMIGRVLEKLFGFEKFSGKRKDGLDSFWEKFIPTYPKHGDLYAPLDMPRIFSSPTHSIAVYQGEGNKLKGNLQDIMNAHLPYYQDIYVFGLIVDADKEDIASRAKEYAKAMRVFFPHFPEKPGEISMESPRTGIYIFPNNEAKGTLESILLKCAEIVYPEHKVGAEKFLTELGEKHKKHWKPFDEQKALVATITSVLKPGKTNTVSISDKNWICEETQEKVAELALFALFLRKLLGLEAIDKEAC